MKLDEDLDGDIYVYILYIYQVTYILFLIFIDFASVFVSFCVFVTNSEWYSKMDTFEHACGLALKKKKNSTIYFYWFVVLFSPFWLL